MTHCCMSREGIHKHHALTLVLLFPCISADITFVSAKLHAWCVFSFSHVLGAYVRAGHILAPSTQQWKIQEQSHAANYVH